MSSRMVQRQLLLVEQAYIESQQQLARLQFELLKGVPAWLFVMQREYSYTYSTPNRSSRMDPRIRTRIVSVLWCASIGKLCRFYIQSSGSRFYLRGLHEDAKGFLIWDNLIRK
jgi:hypothetical protein